MKEKICALMGALAGVMASLLGPWTSDLTALLVLMTVDFLSGVAVALVAVGHQMDAVLGLNYIRTALCVAFLTNEGMSILENAGLMGIPIPTVLQNALDVLHKKEETDGSH